MIEYYKNSLFNNVLVISVLPLQSSEEKLKVFSKFSKPIATHNFSYKLIRNIKSNVLDDTLCCISHNRAYHMGMDDWICFINYPQYIIAEPRLDWPNVRHIFSAPMKCDYWTLPVNIY